MMGRLRVIITLLLALGVAFLASLFIYRWLEQKAKPQTVIAPVEESLPVVAAVTDLTWGTKLTREMIKVVPFFKKSLPKGYFSDIDAVQGRVVIAPLEENEAITESKLAPSSVTTGGAAAVVSPGKRALAVKGDKVIGLSGFIRPGNRVDVLVTLKDTKYKRQITKIVLEDVLVLATGTQMEKSGGKGKSGATSPVDVYTLEMTPEEGEKLGLAATQGRLQFALRNPTDKETVLTHGATVSKTLSSFRPKRKKRSVSTSSKKNPKKKTKEEEFEDPLLTVQIIKGSRVKKIKMRTDGSF